MTGKTPEQQKFDEFYDMPDAWGDDEDDSIDYCDYDLIDEECPYPHLKHSNCCFECDLFIDEEARREETRK